MSRNVVPVADVPPAVRQKPVGPEAAPDRRSFGLDLVRAAAISMVLIAHMFTIPLFGDLGVELFFALSGFLIGGILLRSLEKRGRFSAHELLRFLVRRRFRTLPNYYLVLSVLMFSSSRPAWSEMWRYYVFLQNFVTEAPHFFGESWSLAVEEWFYLLFSVTFFLLALPARSRGGQVWAFGLATGLFLVVPTVLRFLAAPVVDPDFGLRKMVVLRLDAIMYGVLLALIQLRYPDVWPKLPRLLPLGFVGAAAAGFLLMSDSRTELALAYTLLPASFACTLPYFERVRPPNRFVAVCVERLSVWSYSIYLVNAPLGFWVYRAAGFPPLGSVRGVATMALGFTLIILASAVIYRLFERPIMNLRDRVCP